MIRQMTGIGQALHGSVAEALFELFDVLDEVLFWVKDEVHRITAANQAFAERVNRPVEAILGKTDAEGVSVRVIAQEAGMSVATLERRFGEHFRLTPSAFLTQLRVSRACELLRDTPLNMTEVAEACGYESPAAFSRAFQREMGEAPSRFRAMQRH